MATSSLHSFCPACGTQAEADGSYCGMCGRSLLILGAGAEEGTPNGSPTARTTPTSAPDDVEGSTEPKTVITYCPSCRRLHRVPPESNTFDCASCGTSCRFVECPVCHAAQPIASGASLRCNRCLARTDVPRRSTAKGAATKPPPPPAPAVHAASFTGPRDQTNGVAVWALVFAFLIWPVGIILGHIARRTVRRTGERCWVSSRCLDYQLCNGSSHRHRHRPGTHSPIELRRRLQQLDHIAEFRHTAGERKSAEPFKRCIFSRHISYVGACVHSGGTQYSCLVKHSDGSSTTISIMVSSNGTRWVSNG